MAIVSANEQSTEKTRRKSRRRKTSHLKNVPADRQLRELIRAECFATAGKMDKSRPMTKDEMETIARGLLESLGQPDTYVGFTMVHLSSAFWHDQVAATPHSRRLFLLPHCLKHAAGCPADYDEYGLDCKTCGACSIADFRGRAEELGYKILVAEGSPLVLKIIVSGHVDAIVGVACLNVLEKAIDKILLAGIPCMAVPLLSSDCRNTSVDEDWVSDMINVPHIDQVTRTRSYVHVMRGASNMFKEEEMAKLAPRQRNSVGLTELNASGLAALDPISATEAISYDFLMRGGKHSRPFITLAAYDAMNGGLATLGEGGQVVDDFPPSVLKTAMSIETFHKASLVHDDIEDDDAYRYGSDALHRRYGVPTAINVGDYMIGMGYRLVSSEARALGPEVAADILDVLANAHQRLSEGQGAELLWRDSLNKRLKPIDALKIYALKTSPAFEAALYCGIRLAGDAAPYADAIRGFSRNLGVAFQILNDLKDWQGDSDNKLQDGGDILGGRPTVLWALAQESLDAAGKEELEQLVDNASIPAIQRIHRVKRLYNKVNVFDTANRLVDKHQQRAEAVADEVEPEELRRLLYYLIDTVLERPTDKGEPMLEIAPLSTGN